MFGSVGNLSDCGFYASSTFPSFVGFPSSSSLPAHLSRCHPDALVVTDNKSHRVIYGGFSCAQHRSDIYGNSNHHKATGSLWEGTSEGRERETQTQVVTSCFLSKQTSCYEQNRGGDADQCVVDAVFLERVQRNAFQKSLCVFSAEVTKEGGLLNADAAQGIKVKG